jgi:PAS domain S-box-containing protein
MEGSSGTSESRWATGTGGAGAVALTLAADGTILSASELACRLFRLDAAESMGQSIFAFLPSVDEEDRLASAMLTAAQAGAPALLRVGVLMPGTEPRQVRATLEPHNGRDGRLEAFCLRVEPSESNTSAVSARGMARTKITARPAAPPARIGLVLIDRAGCIVQVNDAAAEVLGAESARALIGQPAAALPGADQVDLIRRLRGEYGRVSAGIAHLDLPHRSETAVRLSVMVVTEARRGRRVAADLARRPASAFDARPAVDDHGPATVLLCEVETPLAPAHERDAIESLASQAVAESSDAIIGLSVDQRITFWNRSAQRVLGYAPEEAVGLDAAVLLPPGPDYAEEARRIADELARGQSVRRIETRRMSKSGRPVEVLLTQAPIRDPGGAATGSVLILTDVSEVRRLEAALREAERLKSAGQMASMLAHEVRNPLASAILNIEMLRDEVQEHPAGAAADQERVATLLHRTHAELQELREAAEAYLDLVRMPPGAAREVDLNALLTELTTFLAKEFDAAGVRLELHLDHRLAALPADPIRIKRSLLNIVRNALEAMEGGGVLRVATATDGQTAAVTVTDTGAGMTESQMRRIFEPFFTTKRHGTGLGLPYAQKTVRELGGEVRCQSAPGQGTSFTMVLPIRKEHP